MSDLTCQPYNKISYSVMGDRKKYNKLINSVGGRWNPRLGGGPGWTIVNEKIPDLKKLLKENDISLEIISDIPTKKSKTKKTYVNEKTQLKNLTKKKSNIDKDSITPEKDTQEKDTPEKDTQEKDTQEKDVVYTKKAYYDLESDTIQENKITKVDKEKNTQYKDIEKKMTELQTIISSLNTKIDNMNMVFSNEKHLYENKIDELQKTIETLHKKFDEINIKYTLTLKKYEQQLLVSGQYEQTIQTLKTQYEQTIQTLKTQYEQTIQTSKTQYEDKISDQENKYEQAIKSLNKANSLLENKYTGKTKECLELEEKLNEKLKEKKVHSIDLIKKYKKFASNPSKFKNSIASSSDIDDDSDMSDDFPLPRTPKPR